MRTLLITLLVALLSLALIIVAAAEGLLGTSAGPGTLAAAATRSATQNSITTYGQRQVASAHGEDSDRRILFGDPRVYSAFTDEALLSSLPVVGGSHRATLSDACDYARFCSAVDFWVATDRGESLTPRRWQASLETVEQCNAIAAADDHGSTVAFSGFSWDGTPPDVLNGARAAWLTQERARSLAAPPRLDSDAVRERSELTLRDRIGLLVSAPNRQTLDFLAHLRETRQYHASCTGTNTGADCTGADGLTTMPAGHGDGLLTIETESALGAHVAAHARPADADGADSVLFEIMSGYGSADVYRPFRPAVVSGTSALACPEPAADYWPACHVAGEIVASRCRKDGIDAERCNARAEAARALYLAYEPGGHRVVGGSRAGDWADGDQCRDCFLPAFNYRPQGTAQFRLARRTFAADGTPVRRYVGFTGASASHRARPGNGFKEQYRALNTDTLSIRDPAVRAVLYGPTGSDVAAATPPSPAHARHRAEHERAMSFRYSGALTAVHSQSERVPDLLAAVRARHTYATSGERILLWFSAATTGRDSVPMGGRLTSTAEPRFRVSAAGALKQRPGCPPYVAEALGNDRLERLCRSECYFPADERRLISRIEVVRIRPQREPGEALETLIDDPWLTHVCQPDPLGCSFDFTDPEYAGGERDTTYYVRAIQAPSLAINGGGLRCEYDADGRCVATNPCATESGNPDCLAPVEERAWSSPIYLEWPE